VRRTSLGSGAVGRLGGGGGAASWCYLGAMFTLA
jgi:hypothetical protein